MYIIFCAVTRDKRWELKVHECSALPLKLAKQIVWKINNLKVETLIFIKSKIILDERSTIMFTEILLRPQMKTA